MRSRPVSGRCGFELDKTRGSARKSSQELPHSGGTVTLLATCPRRYIDVGHITLRVFRQVWRARKTSFWMAYVRTEAAKCIKWTAAAPARRRGGKSSGREGTRATRSMREVSVSGTTWDTVLSRERIKCYHIQVKFYIFQIKMDTFLNKWNSVEIELNTYQVKRKGYVTKASSVLLEIYDSLTTINWVRWLKIC